MHRLIFHGKRLMNACDIGYRLQHSGYYLAVTQTDRLLHIQQPNDVNILSEIDPCFEIACMT